MRYQIVLAPEAVDDLRGMKANLRAAVRAGIEGHLRHEPTKTGTSHIQRLRGLSRPRYRLRIEDVRIFYDATKQTVEILALNPDDAAEG